jgi:hypothetical protein
MKEITLPEPIVLGSAGKPAGLADYILEMVFTQRGLYQDAEFCELVMNLQPKLAKLRGEGGQKLRVTDAHHKALVSRGLPDQQAQLLPEIQFYIAQCRLAIVKAEDVKETVVEDKPAKSNGKHATA